MSYSVYATADLAIAEYYLFAETIFFILTTLEKIALVLP